MMCNETTQEYGQGTTHTAGGRNMERHQMENYREINYNDPIDRLEREKPRVDVDHLKKSMESHPAMALLQNLRSSDHK